jgi:hypothetical protein
MLQSIGDSNIFVNFGLDSLEGARLASMHGWPKKKDVQEIITERSHT